MKTRLERVGVFGGTFNPPHIGHLLIAEQAREKAALDRVLFVPAFQPPHKTGRPVTDARHRLHMVRLAIKGNRHFAVSDLEIRQGGISYTVNTLKLLKAEYPSAELFLIMGSDSLLDFPTWKSPGEIGEMADLLVYPRNRFEISGRPGVNVEVLNAPRIDVSSTEIRLKAMRGETIRYLVPSEVEAYIKRHRLYTGEDH